MKEATDNPRGNRLPSGISEEGLVSAIARSGYPVQGVVAETLSDDFVVIEEWGFIDDESGKHRTLDVYAQRDLKSMVDGVEPTLLLLLECKRSQHPYVFFRTSGARDIRSFPIVSGISNMEISVSDGRSTTSRSVAEVLCLSELPFIATGPPVCSAFSHAIPKGKKVDLSGTDPYTRVILPLVKALRHARSAFTLRTKQDLIFPSLQLAICVMDAPMILVESPKAVGAPILAPWVRVARREAVQRQDGAFRRRFFAVDFVHLEFFELFVRKHVYPFGDEFGDRAVRFSDVLRSGARVPSLQSWSLDDVQPRSK